VTTGAPDRHEGLRRAIAAAPPGSPALPEPAVRIVADLVCPWCYIAFTRLRRLLDGTPTVLVWHPFLLNPHLPVGGVGRAHYLERKFGSLAQAHVVHRRMARAGAGENIPFAFGAIRLQPSTVAAHALLLGVAEPSRRLELAAALYRAFFTTGANIGDEAVLRRIAAGVGIDAGTFDDVVTAAAREAVVQAHARAYESGISGVPVCVFGDDHVIAGAQPAEALAALLDLERYRCSGPREGAALTGATARSRP
jgi:predicted DsbA family dithiol-disulfide isomerase